MYQSQTSLQVKSTFDDVVGRGYQVVNEHIQIYIFDLLTNHPGSLVGHLVKLVVKSVHPQADLPT